MFFIHLKIHLQRPILLVKPSSHSLRHTGDLLQQAFSQQPNLAVEDGMDKAVISDEKGNHGEW